MVQREKKVIISHWNELKSEIKEGPHFSLSARLSLKANLKQKQKGSFFAGEGGAQACTSA